MPFLEGLFDTEFSPVVDPMPLPRRDDLSLTLGLSTKSRFVDRLRLGGFALRDLSRPEHATKFGARLEAKVGGTLARGLRFSGLSDISFFGNTPEADASDLRVKAYFEGRLELKLAHYLNLAGYTRLFVFEGQVPATEHFRASYLLGLALELHGAFQL
jgi:hypothetical protein